VTKAGQPSLPLSLLGAAARTLPPALSLLPLLPPLLPLSLVPLLPPADPQPSAPSQRLKQAS
jgi:hypothetical protein